MLGPNRLGFLLHLKLQGARIVPVSFNQTGEKAKTCLFIFDDQEDK